MREFVYLRKLPESLEEVKDLPCVKCGKRRGDLSSFIVLDHSKKRVNPLQGKVKVFRKPFCETKEKGLIFTETLCSDCILRDDLKYNQGNSDLDYKELYDPIDYH